MILVEPIFSSYHFLLSYIKSTGLSSHFDSFFLEMHLSLSKDDFLKTHYYYHSSGEMQKKLWFNLPLFPSHSHITTLKIDQKPLPTTDSTVTSTFWSHGLAEMAGQRNKWVCWPGDWEKGTHGLLGLALLRIIISLRASTWDKILLKPWQRKRIK